MFEYTRKKNSFFFGDSKKSCWFFLALLCDRVSERAEANSMREKSTPKIISARCCYFFFFCFSFFCFARASSLVCWLSPIRSFAHQFTRNCRPSAKNKKHRTILCIFSFNFVWICETKKIPFFYLASASFDLYFTRWCYCYQTFCPLCFGVCMYVLFLKLSAWYSASSHSFRSMAAKEFFFCSSASSSEK